MATVCLGRDVKHNRKTVDSRRPGLGGVCFTTQFQSQCPINEEVDRDRSHSTRSRSNGHASAASGLNQDCGSGMLLGAGGDSPVPGVPFSRKPTPRPKKEESTSITRDRHEVHPQELQNLLNAESPSVFDDAWEVFIARHHRLLLHVARKVMPARESALDARLRKDPCWITLWPSAPMINACDAATLGFRDPPPSSRCHLGLASSRNGA